MGTAMLCAVSVTVDASSYAKHILVNNVHSHKFVQDLAEFYSGSNRLNSSG